MPFWISSGGSSGELLVPSVLVAVPHRAVFWHPVFHVTGREQIPAGSCIFCANHSGMADPIWILLALPEKKMIRIMAKQELRRVPFIGWVMEKFRVIFVNRGAHDIAAFSQCVDALAREQEKLLVFVEGTRCNREKHVRAKTGAVRMAAQAGSRSCRYSSRATKRRSVRSASCSARHTASARSTRTTTTPASRRPTDS